MGFIGRGYMPVCSFSTQSNSSLSLLTAWVSGTYPFTTYRYRGEGHGIGEKARQTETWNHPQTTPMTCRGGGAVLHSHVGLPKVGSMIHHTSHLGAFGDVMGTKASVVREPGKI